MSALAVPEQGRRSFTPMCFIDGHNLNFEQAGEPVEYGRRVKRGRPAGVNGNELDSGGCAHQTPRGHFDRATYGSTLRLVQLDRQER
jgi:hypothetical protein